MRTNDIRLFLADDLTAYRMSFAEVLEREHDMRVVGQVSTIAEARDALNSIHEPVDVAVVGMKLPDGPGKNILPEVHAISPACHLVMMRANWNARDDALAVAAGASALFPRSATTEEILKGIRELCAGNMLIPQEHRIAYLHKALTYQAEEYAAHSALSRLTHREEEILRALAEGKSDKETAEEWGVSRKTVAAHMANLLQKLGVESRLQAVLLALRHGVVHLD